MSAKYNSLEELRRKKALLKKEVTEMEDLLTFDNAKESLSAFTNGFTDKFLKIEVNENGETGIKLNNEVIIKEITSGVKEKFISRNAVMGFADSAVKGGAFEDIVRLGATALVGGFAKKKIKSANWKQKLIGIALIYVAPFVLRWVREKLEDYQQRKSISSMEKLI